MIERKLHWVWFGSRRIPRSVRARIARFRELMPDYDVRIWRECDFGEVDNTYFRQALSVGEWAFASDFARLWVLYHHGGVYLDVDVVALRPFDDLMSHHFVVGREAEGYVGTAVILAEKGAPFIGRWLRTYDFRQFLVDGRRDKTTNVAELLGLLEPVGVIRGPMGQSVSFESRCLSILPQEAFGGFDYISGESCVTGDSYAVHLFEHSWGSLWTRYRSKARRLIRGFWRVLGGGK